MVRRRQTVKYKLLLSVKESPDIRTLFMLYDIFLISLIFSSSSR